MTIQNFYAGRFALAICGGFARVWRHRTHVSHLAPEQRTHGHAVQPPRWIGLLALSDNRH